MLEIICRYPNLRVIIRITIFLIYLLFALLPGGMIMLSELDRNPQGEFCETINYTSLKYRQDKLGFVFIFPNFVPYDPAKHGGPNTFYVPSSEGSFAGANWIADGHPCRLQFNALIVPFLPGFLFLSIPAMLIFRAITKNLF